MKERRYWKNYMKAYEECLSATSTKTAPWYIVPADDKSTTRLIVSRIILDTLKDLKLEYPKLSPKHQQELRDIRKLLAKRG
jgi:polyphosphate kinase 2 (PPK2 family)